MRVGIAMQKAIQNDPVFSAIRDGIRCLARTLDHSSRLLAADLLVRWALWAEDHLPPDVQRSQEILLSTLIHPDE